jgi:chaperone modulatory protein CbpM
MPERAVLIGVLVEETGLTLEQLCSVCAVDPQWVADHVMQGHLPANGTEPSQWRFGSREIRRVRQIRQIERAFDADPELAALVADLVDELDGLRARLRRQDA